MDKPVRGESRRVRDLATVGAVLLTVAFVVLELVASCWSRAARR
jgi:uncharacterized membrane protein